MRFFVAARTRFAESCLAEAVSMRCVRQVVVLGAGLDTFAYRHEHGDQLRVFEVDHPTSQAWKRRRLAEVDIQVPSTLVFAPVDFEREDVGGRLAAVGFDSQKRTFFLWLGVAPYLTQEAVRSTLRYVASLPGGAEVAFDYSEPAAALPEAQRQAHEELAARVASVGEPFLSYFEPPTLRAQLEALGFRSIEDLSVRGLAARLFGQTGPGLAALPDKGGHVVHAATG